MNIFSFIFLFFWQLPSNILGSILYIIFRPKWDNNLKVFTWKYSLSFSAGFFIFLGKEKSDFVLLHEKGHQLQSKILGPLYPILISIPSAIWAFIYPYTSKSYYWFYTEKLANKLMHI